VARYLAQIRFWLMRATSSYVQKEAERLGIVARPAEELPLHSPADVLSAGPVGDSVNYDLNSGRIFEVLLRWIAQ
jgi:hypothetical protein